MFFRPFYVYMGDQERTQGLLKYIANVSNSSKQCYRKPRPLADSQINNQRGITKMDKGNLAIRRLISPPTDNNVCVPVDGDEASVMPALALWVDPPDPDLMDRLPRDSKESVFTKKVQWYIGALAINMFVAFSRSSIGIGRRRDW